MFTMLGKHSLKSVYILYSCIVAYNQSEGINVKICNHFKNFDLRVLGFNKMSVFLMYFISWEKVNVLYLIRTYHIIRPLSWRYIWFFSFTEALCCLYFVVCFDCCKHITCYIKQQSSIVFLRNSWTFSWNCPRKQGILR
jgi:hypothetical protein